MPVSRKARTYTRRQTLEMQLTTFDLSSTKVPLQNLFLNCTIELHVPSGGWSARIRLNARTIFSLISLVTMALVRLSPEKSMKTAAAAGAAW